MMWSAHLELQELLGHTLTRLGGGASSPGLLCSQLSGYRRVSDSCIPNQEIPADAGEAKLSLSPSPLEQVAPRDQEHSECTCAAERPQARSAHYVSRTKFGVAL